MSFFATVPLTCNQVRGFLAAWPGWTLNGMDLFLCALVPVAALRELLPKAGIKADQAGTAVAFLLGIALRLAVETAGEELPV